MRYINGRFILSGGVDWQLGNADNHEEEGVTVHFTIYSCNNQREALTRLSKNLEETKIDWLRPVQSVMGNWLLNADELKSRFDLLHDLDWFRGRAVVMPECDLQEDANYEILRHGFRPHKKASIRFVMTRKEMRISMQAADFPELTPSLQRFKTDYPSPAICAFIMIKYENTKQHQAILATVRETCTAFGFTALRADDKAYADERLPNIRTYMHGCGFGIAVLERLTDNDFNPNVSLEIGYMMALAKPVCLLKDSTLQSLQTDLVGRLYESFDTQNPTDTIRPVLEKWFRDRNLI